MKINKQNTENINIERLVGKLKKEDLNYARLCRVVQIIYWIFIPLFAIITIVKLIEEWQIKQLISGISYILSFIILIIFFGKYYNEYRYVDYSQPTIKMLGNAAYRYQLLQLRSIWILIALILMDIGMSLSGGLDTFWQTQQFFAGTIILAFIIGFILWYIKYKPLRDNALQLINEIKKEC